MKSTLSALLIVLALTGAPALAASTAKQAPNQVVISEYMFAPGTVNVAVGATVTWVNHDDVPHTIVDSAVPKTFHSSALDTNDTYSFTFTKPGTYHYFCTLHPKMVGTIVVADAK